MNPTVYLPAPHCRHLLSGLLYVFLLFAAASCRQQTGPVAINPVELTITDVHRAYRTGAFNSRQLVQACLERIEQYDSVVNAITFINPEALEQARQLDEEYARTGRLRPLHGIPLVVKDNINVAGLPTTAGSRALAGYMPAEDALIVRRLVAAGAIVVAKTNMAEWAFSPMHTESTTGGTTRNPYNPAYVPAGSSGGTAAAIAAGFAIIGLGTDTGNSIRGPSSHNALVGFRTTMGLVGRSGIVPLFLRNDVAGPMCRTVEDATRVLEVIAGPDPADSLTAYAEGKIPAGYRQFLQADGLQGARIGVLRELSEQEPDAQVAALFEQALADLDSLGAKLVDPVVIPGLAGFRQNQWCAMFREDIEAFLKVYVRSDTLHTLEDIIAAGTDSEFAAGRLARFAAHSGRLEKPEIPCLDAYTDVRRVAYRQAIEKVMDSLQLNAIVYPSWNNRPARIEHFEEEYKGDNSQAIAPHTGQPAFTVPMGFTSGHLPAGLQFLGRMYDEPTLIRLACAYEQGTRHRQPPGLRE